jgi:UDP-GlcNAc:undecaprenyl-phosphate GlcNAc-1-phosphate transferase
MSSNMATTFFMFEGILVSLILALGFAWASVRLALRVRLIDYPGSAPHKKHVRPTPLAGGIALVLTLLASELFFGTFTNPAIKATFVAGSIVFFFGLWDDFNNSRPIVKLIGQIIAAIVLIRMGVYVQIFESPEFFIRVSGPLTVYADWLLTILWVVGITNAFNFVDSMDGLAVGLGGMAAAFFMLVTLNAQQQQLSLHSALIIGMSIGLYLFNSPPALLFLGDAGAQLLGFILATLAIAYNPQGANQSSSWVVPIMLLGVPIFDSALVIISRLRRKRSIYTASMDHTYHRLLNLGLEPFRAVVAMQIAALSLGCLAFVILTQPPLVANIVFIFVVLLGVLALIVFDRPKYLP